MTEIEIIDSNGKIWMFYTEGIYNPYSQIFVSFGELSKDDLVRLWNLPWKNERKKKSVLKAFCGTELFNACKKASVIVSEQQ